MFGTAAQHGKGTIRGTLSRVLLPLFLAAGTGEATLVAPTHAAPAAISCFVNAGSVAHLSPCVGAPGTTINVYLTRALKSPPLMLLFKAVIANGVPMQVSAPLSGSGSLYTAAAAPALCTNGWHTWEVYLVDQSFTLQGDIGQFTSDCRAFTPPVKGGGKNGGGKNGGGNGGGGGGGGGGGAGGGGNGGNGGAPVAVNVAPAGLNFGSVFVGNRAGPQMLTITNTSTVPEGIAWVQPNPAGVFSGGQCRPLVLAPGASCTIAYYFAPSHVGHFVSSITISVYPHGPDWPRTVIHKSLTYPNVLAGDGVRRGRPLAALDPVRLDFGAVMAGTSSDTQVVTLKNTGDGDLTIGSAYLAGADSGAFAMQGNCAGTLPPLAACTESVTFTPRADGSYSAGVVFVDNAGTQQVSLGGQGFVPAPKPVLDTETLSFPDMPIGTSSEAQSVTLHNEGDGPLNLGPVGITGDGAGGFSVNGDCAGALQPGASCTEDVTFAPADAGEYNATLAFSDSAGNNTGSVGLGGAGIAVKPDISASPSSADFGTLDAGATSDTQTITFTNDGNGAANIGQVTVDGGYNGFAITGGDCTGALAPNASCTEDLTFTPPVAGAYTATLAMIDDQGNTLAGVNLTGAGTDPEDQASLNVDTLSFQTTAGSLDTESVTLTNAGDRPLTIGDAAIGGDDPSAFTVTGDCAGTLAPYASCTEEVTFTPSAAGDYSANLVFETPDRGIATVTLNGTDTPSTTCDPSSDPSCAGSGDTTGSAG